MTKYWAKSIYLYQTMFPWHPANDSLKLNQFVSIDVWVLFLFLYSLNFVIAQKKNCFAYQNWSYLCCIKTQENWFITWKKLRNQFRINQICKLSPFDKTNREYQIFGILRFVTIFDNFLLPKQLDLSAHRPYNFLTSNVLRLRCNNALIFLWRFQW